MFNLRLTDEMKEAEIIFSWAVQGGEDGGTPAIYNPKYRSQCNRWYSDIYICLNKIRSIVYSHTMGKKMLNMRKSNIPPHQLKLQKTTTYYTSLVRKLVTLDTSISVSTISNPERLGYRRLKFVSQSSFALVGVFPTVGLRS